MRCHIPENTIGWFYMWSVDIITLKLIQCVIFKDMTILVRTIFYLLQDGYIYIYIRQMEKGTFTHDLC